MRYLAAALAPHLHRFTHEDAYDDAYGHRRLDDTAEAETGTPTTH